MLLILCDHRLRFIVVEVAFCFVHVTALNEIFLEKITTTLRQILLV